jgi:SAM-dependent methyltransferase
VTEPQIPVVARRPVKPSEPEYRECMKYESEEAEQEAGRVAGSHEEPWLNVLDEREPGSVEAVEMAIGRPEIARYIRGRAIDLGAGTGWATARLSRCPPIETVVALDMSERFLTVVGSRVIQACGGNTGKIRFAVGSFNDVPFPAGSFDCAFLIAAVHHSLSPLKTLLEARRVLRPDGALLVVEMPSPVLAVRRRRRQSIEMSRNTGATEICYTTGELDYLLRHAGFERLSYHPVDGLTRTRWRAILRLGLRRARLENLVRPPVYVVVARQRGEAE